MTDDAGSFDPTPYRVIASAILARIAEGTYPPRSALPPIGAFMDEFQVSRDTVTKALRVVADTGRIERFAGLGWYVT